MRPEGKPAERSVMQFAEDVLGKLRRAGERRFRSDVARIAIGMGTCGRAAGAVRVFGALRERVSSFGSDASLVQVGCRGLCYAEPLVEVRTVAGGSFLFGGVHENLADDILAFSLCGNLSAGLAKRLLDPAEANRGCRRVLEHCGVIDPFSIEEYVATGGYAALAAALVMGPSKVLETVDTANLRGRGGGGFPAGRKWRTAFAVEADQRYIIVNGDEGDPGAYMDRGLLESDPHRVLEGLILCAYAVDASKAFFFIRAEYPLAVQTVSQAIDDATKAGFLGKNILGSGFDLQVDVVRGAGAFLCGESTAMINVLENKECMARITPPYPTERGLWDKPTCVNNVETLANIPAIIEHGSDWFQSVGTQDSPGTKVLSVTGAVSRGGLIEVPMGIALESLLGDYAAAADAKAVQIGGPSGVIVPSSLKGIEVSFEGFAFVGGMIGSGGFVVLSSKQCVVDTALYLTRFSKGQSCGRCTACREGLEEAAEILRRITIGEGKRSDTDRLQYLAKRGADSSLCALGGTALNPVLSSLRFFPEEYTAHLRGICPGRVCVDLISYSIDEGKCQGERCCLATCPGNAIKGSFGKPGRIVSRLCKKCGMCMISCPYGAVEIVSPAVR